MSVESYEFTRGDAWPFTLDTITDLNGAAVTDVSAWSCRSSITPISGGAAVALASTTAASGVATISRGTGLFSWIIPKAVTANVSPDFYFFDAEVTDPSGNPQTFHSVVKVLADQSI
jgi:hypothetical protein